MICSKCGAKCEDNQAFCLSCGNPMQLTADFNLIEKELASNIDRLMSEIDYSDDTDDQDDDVLKTIDVPLEEIDMGLKVLDVSRNQNRFNVDSIYDDDDDEDITPVHSPDRRREGTRNNVSKSKKSKNSKKKLYAIIGGCVAAVALIVLILILVLGGDDDDSTANGFNGLYSSAESSLKSGDLGTALDKAYDALDKVSNDEEEIKVRKLIYNIYNEQNFTGALYFENIEALVALGDTSEDYYGYLVSKYLEEGNTNELLNIMSKLDEETVKGYLWEEYVEKPEPSEETGEYKNKVKIALTAQEGCKIFYTLDDEDLSNAVEYSEEIAINEAGEHIVRAYAVSADGIPSMPATLTYSIVEGDIEGPVVSPNGGTYTEAEMIEVEVPEGCTVYYTYTENGERPDENSTKYTEPVKMIRGVNEFRAIAIDENGNVSQITTEEYNLKLERKETITSGKDKVWSYYYNNGMIDPDGNMADGAVLEISYENAVEIEGDEYYVYTAVSTLVDGETSTTTGISYVGVNTYDGTVVAGLLSAGDEYLLPE